MSDATPAPPPAPVAPGHPRPLNPVASILAAGVVAGLIAWLGGEACRDLIQPPRHAVNSKGVILKVVIPREQDVADARNAGLAFAWQGLIFGASLGAVGGLARRSKQGAMRAALFGAVAGAVACAAMSAALLPLYNAYKHRDPDAALRDLRFPVFLQAAIWSCAGAVGGLAYALGRGERNLRTRAVSGGWCGAVVAAAVYELIGVMAFPDSGIAQFVSWTWPTRLMARLAFGILAAAGIALAIAPPREDQPAPASAMPEGSSTS